ncbi:hypothetical protein H5P28_17225 [Ruficoccus amylovorans]|uniref:Uncharacterized protein n=1 Tax=Ruficoccus amylovorans TaxID=1804625 RepID=A0A842HLK9_9BACT|nr:hypothetical protein [Ruficoccus amylovorans]MBC2596011.1 hypothetical protein [Ruficoccus amylovorans]
MSPSSCFARPALLVFLAGLLGTLAAHAEEPEQISVEFRTLGWGLQDSNLVAGSNDSRFSILNSQVSGPYRYVGQPTMYIYRGSALPPKDDMLDQGLESAEADAPTATPPGTPLPPPKPIARIPNLKNRQKLLIFFLPNTDRSNGQAYKILTFDDSGVDRKEPGIEFYNFSGQQLALKILDDVHSVANGRVTYIKVKREVSKSVIAVAVTTPKPEMVYVSRFRLKQDQRMMFLAIPDSSGSNGGVKIVSMLQSLEPSYSGPQDLPIN